MESRNHGVAPVTHGSGSQLTIGFPLATALLLLIIFIISGIFSFFYHWEKRRHTAARVEAGALHVIPQPPHLSKSEGLPVVVMPGDNFPKFIALPAPCEPPRLERVIVDVPPPPPKPLRTLCR